MSICSKYNLTFVIYSLEFNRAIYVEDDHVKGFVGQHLQQLISSKKFQPYYCSLVAEERIGTKQPNGSYR